MNQAHLHLIIVHLPIVLVPLGLILFLVGMRWNSKAITLTALSLNIASAFFAGAAFLLGEGAEEIVEHVAGVVESAIEAHESSATWALWTTVTLGLVSLVSSVMHKFKESLAVLLKIPIILLGLISTASLAKTAQDAGKIKHPEAYTESQLLSNNLNDKVVRHD